MEGILDQLEKKLRPYGQFSSLRPSERTYFPKKLKVLYNYQIFGANLLALPTEIILKGEEEEYQKPFSFVSDQEHIAVFESEYREFIPKKFTPFGYLHGASEVVLLDTEKDTVHIFHVSDVCDLDWLQRKLTKEITSLSLFLNAITIQSVSCFINPNNYAEASLLEIRNGNIYYELCENKQDIEKEYLALCHTFLKKGFDLHYAPQKIRDALDQPLTT